MNDYLFDTDIISYFFKGNDLVSRNIKTHLQQNNHSRLNISLITYYEIISGLSFRQASGQLTRFLANLGMFNILPLTEKSCDVSARFYALTRKAGNVVDDIDLLIGGVAVANNLILVTNNEKHYANIPSFSFENWAARYYF